MQPTIAVITASGLGTRLWPLTKSHPKEFLPLFVRENQNLILKPAIQIIYETLFDYGIRDFCITTSTNKRVIEDYFSINGINWGALTEKPRFQGYINDFHAKLQESIITFTNQPEPHGFGEAVYLSRICTQRTPFIVQAGDTILKSQSNTKNFFNRILKVWVNERPDAVFFVQQRDDWKTKGVIVGTEVGEGLYTVRKAFEKPTEYVSDLTIVPFYIFAPEIHQWLVKSISKIDNYTWEVTDGIKTLIESGGKVMALELMETDVYLDIGTPENYKSALEWSLGEELGD